jgi:hypothetical protein
MTPFTSIVIFVPAVKAAIALALVKYKFVNSGTFAVLNPPILSGEIAPGAIILAVTEFGERDVDNDPFCASNVTEFAPWWEQYSQPLCQYWNIPSWTVHDIFSVSVFGKVPNIEAIITNLKNNYNPVKVIL